MCGIVGVIGNGIIANDLKVYKQMLIADSFRGMHSTGQFSVGAAAGYDLFKRAVPGWGFLEHKAADDMISASKRVIIGHNRYATQGAVNSVNAHPFDTGEIVGVHNGSLFDTKNLHKGDDYVVDSEALINDIALNGAAHTTSIAKGAFALVWYDSRDRKLRIIRNSQRPMAIYLHPNRDVAYIASEIDMLRWIVGRNDSTFDEELLMPIAAGELWEFDVSRTSKMTESVEYSKIEVADEYPPVKTTYGNWSYGGQGYGGGSSKKPASGPSVTTGYGTGSSKRPRSQAELSKAYDIQVEDKIIADITHVTSCNNVKSGRAWNLSGKILHPDNMAGLTVSAFHVSDEIGGAGIFEGSLVSIYEDTNDKVRAVVRGHDLRYLGDSKEVIEFQKKTVPAPI
ncbi:MAG TPA: hypothetical protein V6D20_13510 [Candidatus Obscuribacterales bacterium]